MSLIHIARNNVVLGQFTDAEVLTGLQNGAYLSTDLAWRAGMSQWKPIGEWPEFVPASGSGTGMPPPMSTLPDDAYEPPAWEKNPSPSGYFATVKAVTLRPMATFSRMAPTGGIGKPFFFYIVGLIPTSVCSAIAAYFNPQPFARFLPHPEHAAQNNAFESMSPAGHALFSLFTGLFCAPIGLFLMAGITHLMLMLWRAANRPFDATFRACAYTTGAFSLVFAPANLLMGNGFTAIIGMAITLGVVCWSLVLQIIALAKIHRTSIGKAACAYFTPGIVCCCLYMILALAAVAFVAARH